jgi:hypothetical protein
MFKLPKTSSFCDFILFGLNCRCLLPFHVLCYFMYRNILGANDDVKLRLSLVTKENQQQVSASLRHFVQLSDPQTT